MTTYYERHQFPNNDAKEHALQVATRFFNGHRFFPCEPYQGKPEADPDYMLDPSIFGDIITAHANLKAVYRQAKLDATKAIEDAETASGITPASLRNGQTVVQCNCYGGGMTLCRIYPLTAFIETAPKTLAEVRDHLFSQHMGNKTDDDISPKERRGYEEHAERVSTEVWEQLEAVDHLNPQNTRCLAMLQPSFNLGSYGKLLCDGSLTKWQEHPMAAGCLCYGYSQQRRMMTRRGYMIFSTTRADHVFLRHESDNNPSIRYHDSGGYDYAPMFVTIQ